MAKKKKQKEQQPPQVVIDYIVPENITAKFATHMLVQILENEFEILFFQIRKPIVITEEDMEKWRQSGTVRADCIGRFILTPDRMVRFIAALNEQLSRYNAKLEARQEKKEES